MSNAFTTLTDVAPFTMSSAVLADGSRVGTSLFSVPRLASLPSFAKLQTVQSAVASDSAVLLFLTEKLRHGKDKEKELQGHRRKQMAIEF